MQQAEQRQSAKLERAYGSRQSPPIYSEEITGNSSSNMAFQAQYRDILPPITQKASTIKSGQSAEVSEDAEASRMVGGIQDKDRTAIRRCPEAAATNIPAAFGAATSTVQVHYNQQPASPNLSLRDEFSPRTLAPASSLPSEPVPHWIETFPLAQAYIQVEPVPQTSSSSCQADAFLVHPPRHNLSPSIPAQTSILPSPAVPAPIPQFPPALQSYSRAQQCTALSTSTPPSQCSAPPSLSSRRHPLRLAVFPATPSIIETPPRSANTFPQAQTTPLPEPVNITDPKSKPLFQANATAKASPQGPFRTKRQSRPM